MFNQYEFGCNAKFTVMKKYFLSFVLLSLSIAMTSTSQAQKKYFTDIADSLRIDSILKAESNYPSNMVMVRSDTSSCTIYNTPSKNAETLSVMALLEFPAAIIISRGNKETIGGKTDYWYRVYFEEYPGPKTGWVFGGDAVLLTPDMESNSSAYNGKYVQYVGDPCIFGLSIRANSAQKIIVKTYYVSYGLDEPSFCSGIPVALKNVKIKGNVFSSDSSDLKKGWFMKAAKKGDTKFKGYLMMQAESGLYPYLKLNSSTDIIDYEF